MRLFKKIIGWSILLSLPIGLFVTIGLTHGWWMAISSYGATAIVAGLICLAVNLIYD